MLIFNRLFTGRRAAKTHEARKLERLRAMSAADLADIGAKPADAERMLARARATPRR